ncbi:MAG: hypothetical protein EXS36_01315 [Pedosphaera sp.]|nr:hypothetical protein [Pedosphaera sp.]
MRSPKLTQSVFPSALILSLIGLQPSCAVITKSQRAEVAAFAKVASNYGTLPGEPIRSYGHATRFDRLLNVSAHDFQSESARTNAWAEIAKAIETDKKFDEAARQADAALDVLDQYVEILTLLSSDEFTDALDKSAKELGASVDKGIKSYNQTFLVPKGQKELAPVGATVAAAVQGAGGIYIRYRQAKLLKNAVVTANPVVAALTHNIAGLMRDKVKPYLTQANERLGDDFKNAARQAKDLPFGTIQEVAFQVERSQNAFQLAEAAAKASESLAASHKKLAAELTSRKSIEDRIQEIQALADEIKAAQKLQKALSK